MESEYYSLVSACQEGRFTQQLLQEVTGKPCELVLKTDSDAARLSVEKPGGSLRAKHMELRYLFLKQLQREGVISVMRIPSARNPADLFTKILGWRRMEEILNVMSCWSVRGLES
jgi:hypothetical protein